MRGIGIGATQQLIELVLAPGNGVGDVQTEMTETRSADGNQERRRGLCAGSEFGEALLDQIVSWKVIAHRRIIRASNVRSGHSHERPVGFSHRCSDAAPTRSPSGVT